jgi:hypothetical protein
MRVTQPANTSYEQDWWAATNNSPVCVLFAANAEGKLPLMAEVNFKSAGVNSETATEVQFHN